MNQNAANRSIPAIENHRFKVVALKQTEIEIASVSFYPYKT
jgi:hypothetical protein